MDDVLELYMEGLSIENISYELGGVDDEYVIECVRLLKRKDVNGKDYIYEFKEMVVERILSGIKKGQVAKELGIAYRTINKYLDEFNAEVPKNKKEKDEQMFAEINWHNFSVCPECKGVHVNDLNAFREENTQRNSYCLDCGTEWLERGGKVYKVLWEFVK